MPVAGEPRSAPSVWSYLAAALVLALVLAAVGIFAMQRFFGKQAEWGLSLGTAIVVGLVIAAAILGSRRHKVPPAEPAAPTSDVFEVEVRR